MTSWMSLTLPCALLLSTFLGGCHAERQQPPTALWSSSASSTPRPAGIALDLEPVWPEPAVRLRTEQGLGVLGTPADIRRAHETVRRFFGAILREDQAELGSLLSEDASVVVTKSGQRVPARALWQQRFSQLDYSALEGKKVYQQDKLEIYRAEAPALSTRLRCQLGSDRRPGLLVRVPIETTHVARARLFGEEMWLLLRPVQGGLRIFEAQEYYDLP